MIRLGNNEALKTLRKTLTFVDAAANANANANAAANADANPNADAEASTITLRERCSGKLKRERNRTLGMHSIEFPKLKA